MSSDETAASPTPDDLPLRAIYNYRRISDRLATSGMPTEPQLAEIARAGFEVVLNLDQLDSDYALPDERHSVEALGMSYRQIPVVWVDPQPADLVAFRTAMAALSDRRLFVHCVANLRVSTFLALHQILDLGHDREATLRELHARWQPNPTWQRFIDRELAGTGAR